MMVEYMLATSRLPMNGYDVRFVQSPNSDARSANGIALSVEHGDGRSGAAVPLLLSFSYRGWLIECLSYFIFCSFVYISLVNLKLFGTISEL